MQSLPERFSSFKTNDTYSLVSPHHVLKLYIGIDENGNKALKYRGNFSIDKIRDTAFIKIRQTKYQEHNVVLFSLLNEAAESIFLRFCQDLIEVTQNESDEQNGYRVLRDRYLHWRQLFSNAQQDLLTENQVIGLIGEILSLRDHLIPRYGASIALIGWSGQELTHKDFSYEDMWFESKSVSDSSSTVKISSLEQLDSNTQGYLLVYKMEKLSPAAEGIRLNDLVDEMMTSLNDISLQEDFMKKISMQGYSYLPDYNAFVYRQTEHFCFSVKNGFPRLTKQNINPAIAKASYEISISEILPFLEVEIPER